MKIICWNISHNVNLEKILKCFILRIRSQCKDWRIYFMQVIKLSFISLKHLDFFWKTVDLVPKYTISVLLREKWVWCLSCFILLLFTTMWIRLVFSSAYLSTLFNSPTLFALGKHSGTQLWVLLWKLRQCVFPIFSYICFKHGGTMRIIFLNKQILAFLELQ